MYATVILNSRQFGIGNGLTYEVKPRQGIGVGFLVKVPLRKRLIEGIVVDLSREKPDGNYDLKEIADVLSESPLLSSLQIEMAKWMAEYYMCSLRQALSPFLPGGEWSKLLPQREEWVRSCVPRFDRAQRDTSTKRMGKKQAQLLEFLEGKGWMQWDEVKEEIGVGREVLKRLVERELIEMKEEMSPFARPQGDTLLSDVSLTPTQTLAYKSIKSDNRPTLLFGVTGSGKTEVYAALIRDVILQGKSAILLLPEILLTENFIGRFQQLVDRSAIAIMHSRLTPAQRRDAWRRCKDGSIRLVIGSRSALFSPLPDLGLIVVDEEHEWTYKNEQAPRYHAVKVAEKMCELRPVGARGHAPLQAHPKLLLGTATPSVDSWYRAQIGDYQLAELPERYGGAALPSVQIVDLAQIEFGKYYPLSPTLINAIRLRLDRHEQSVLFLNRRGFATSLLCLDCRYRFEDKETKLPYTVHFRGPQPYLLSHHTGEELSIPSKCPQCQSANLKPVGAGTQKIEALLEDLFPSARILRADADTLKSPEQMRILLSKMKEGRADILLGTQSVVKGLDLPLVTLAAVLLADVGLSLPHFRAGERVFQLLTQLTGRSGRAKPGEVIIQTFRPQAVEIELAAAHDVRTYLTRELAERQKAHYPPDSEMVRFVFSGPDARQRAKSFSGELSNNLKPNTYNLSCSPSLFTRSTWYVFLRGKNVREVLKNLPPFEGVVDVDPIECL